MSRLFLSCVTRELGSYRTLLTQALQRAGVDLRVQEQFGVGGGTLLDWLDRTIQQCDAVIHLIGRGTGAFPEEPAVRALRERYAALPEGDISYTQWEAYLAIHHRRPVYFYLPTADAPCDPDFTPTDRERKSQEAHLARIVALGRHRGSFENQERLAWYVLADLRDILASDSEALVVGPSRLPRKNDASVFEGREGELAALDALWDDAMANKPGRAQIVSLVAIGGAGKTTLASRWKDALLARPHQGGVERYFDWSFYNQGTRRGGEADATEFVAAALEFFGDHAMAENTAHPWEKGARLAALAAKHRTLLILDGLEPLQHPPGPQQGELKDDALRALFAGLRATRGLCVVTTREPIADLALTRETITPQWKLDHLTDAAGALVLARHGVAGDDAEFRAASAEVKGHALTLSLMGRYLALAFDPPDIRRRDSFRFSEADAETEHGHAFRIFATYEQWLERADRHVELAILRLLGLFDRPAAPDCIAALCAAPAIPGLTEPLVDLGERRWNIAINRLRELDLVETVEWTPADISGYDENEAEAEMAAGKEGRATDLGPLQPFERDLSSLALGSSLDAHPLLREYFDEQSKTRGVAAAAHDRLFEYLCASVPYWPEGRDGLLPLYQAVAHGCKAGRYLEACAGVYLRRICRGSFGAHAYYSAQKLGLLALDLAAVVCFFVEPWRKTVDLPDDARAWLFSEAGYRLRGLNRLVEALEPMRADVKLSLASRQWWRASAAAGNLSELELTLGNVDASVKTAAEAVALADEEDDSNQQVGLRTTHANALYAAGRLDESDAAFAEAEALQQRALGVPILFGPQGYRACDRRVLVAEWIAWREYARPGSAEVSEGLRSLLADSEMRAEFMLELLSFNASLISRALAQLARGRVYLLRAILENAKLDLLNAREHLNTAVTTLRQAMLNHELPAALLPSAWVDALLGEWNLAQERLDESFSVATRGTNPRRKWEGGMRLHLVDTLLVRARLFAKRDPYPWPGRTPRMDLEEAATLIDICGYHRRDEELADAMAAIT